jgi:hypothetical protein
VPKDGRDNRKAPRLSVLGHAVIIAPAGRANCIVRDISKTGARLGLSRDVKLPAAFDLFLVKTNSKRHVLLRWRAGDFAGVEFCEHAASMSMQGQTPQEEDVWIM